jgi:hypothetical protein
MRMLTLGALASVLFSAGECEFSKVGDFLDKPGQIVVTNVGSDPAVVAIIGPDVKSYPTLAGGATASAETNVGGQYQVRVVMTPENAQRYRDDLIALKRDVQKLVDGSLTTSEKTTLFSRLAGINAAIAALEQANAAGCSGNITLNHDNTETVNATVNFVRAAGGGFWDTTCGSNTE